MALDDITLAMENVVADGEFAEKLRTQVRDCPFPVMQLDCDNIYYNALVQRECGEPRRLTEQLFAFVTAQNLQPGTADVLRPLGLQQNLVLNTVIEELGRRIAAEPVLSVVSTLLELFAQIFTHSQTSEKQSLAAHVAFRAALKNKTNTLTKPLRAILKSLEPGKLKIDD